MNAEKHKELDIWQMRRLDVKPGITCFWQVRGRGEWTIPVVLKRKGAY